MGNRIMTLESLVDFCKSQKAFSYNANETGHPLVVTTFGELEYTADNDNGLLGVSLKSCHVGLNRNGSFISNESMTKAISSFANKPILAEFTVNSKGLSDFGTHAMEVILDENGEPVLDEDGNVKIHFIEQPVGIVPESNNSRLIYDEDYKKDFLWVDGYVFKYYGNETAEILERKKGTKVSIEIDIQDMAWDAKNKWLDIKDFIFNGITLLSDDVGEGMYGARCDIADFSHYESYDYSKEINEMKSRLQMLEARFSNNNSKEGGNQQVKFEELLAKYGKTIEDIDFEYEGLSDEELEAKFAEVFADDNTSSGEDNSNGSENGEGADNSGDNNGKEGGTEPVTEPTTEGQDDSSGQTGGDNTGQEEGNSESGIPLGQKDEDDEGQTKKFSLNHAKIANFELSLQEKISALSNLVSATYEEADNEWYSTLVYNDYVIMVGWFKGHNYRQNYKEENEEFTLVGDRVEVFEKFLTQDEIDKLEEMKSNYSALQEFKAKTENDKLEENRKALLEDERFSMIFDTEAYQNLVNEVANYSVEELEDKLKMLVGEFVLGNGSFSKVPSTQKSGLQFGNPNRKKNPIETNYGGIFSEKK